MAVGYLRYRNWYKRIQVKMMLLISVISIVVSAIRTLILCEDILYINNEIRLMKCGHRLC